MYGKADIRNKNSDRGEGERTERKRVRPRRGSKKDEDPTRQWNRRRTGGRAQVQTESEA